MKEFERTIPDYLLVLALRTNCNLFCLAKGNSGLSSIAFSKATIASLSRSNLASVNPFAAQASAFLESNFRASSILANASGDLSLRLSNTDWAMSSSADLLAGLGDGAIGVDIGAMELLGIGGTEIGGLGIGRTGAELLLTSSTGFGFENLEIVTIVDIAVIIPPMIKTFFQGKHFRF